MRGSTATRTTLAILGASLVLGCASRVRDWSLCNDVDLCRSGFACVQNHCVDVDGGSADTRVDQIATDLGGDDLASDVDGREVGVGGDGSGGADAGVEAKSGCDGDQDCRDPDRPACITSSRICVPCTADSHCSGSKPACDTSSNTCVQCSADKYCSAPKPACDLAAKTCVECGADKYCSAPKPACDTTTKTCIGCNDDKYCSAPKPACDVPGKSCVGCLARNYCGGATPACDVIAKVCVACLASTDCSGSKAVCDVGAQTCVECLANSDCKSPTKPICDQKACRACQADSECVTRNGADPGVCMAHQDGRCATDAEAIYVKAGGTCSDSSENTGGTVAMPYCSMQPTVTTVGATRDLIVVRGAVNGATSAFSAGTKQISIVGQTSAAIAGGISTVFHLSAGDAYIRDVKLTASTGVGCQADVGATVRLQHVVVNGNAGGGILLDGAAFTIANTTVTNNGPGTLGPANWGGIFVNNPPPAGPKQLQQVTVQTNNGGGISCSGSVQATGVLADGNTNTPFQITSACGFSSCGTAGPTCGAQP